MPETALTPIEAKTMEQVAIGGDLAQLSAKESASLTTGGCVRALDSTPSRDRSSTSSSTRQAHPVRKQGLPPTS